MELEPTVHTTRLYHNLEPRGIAARWPLSVVPRATWHLEGAGSVDSLVTEVCSDVEQGRQ